MRGPFAFPPFQCYCNAALVINVRFFTILVAWLAFACSSQAGEFTQDAYVWQRAWTAQVREAVQDRATNFNTLVVLAAEVSWKQQSGQVVRVPVDFATLQNVRSRVGLALRIGPFAGPFEAEAGSCRWLCQLARSLVQEAAAKGVNVRELQIDFDCAESKLGGYRAWIEAIRGQVAPVPVVITALPTWLNQPAFKPLAAAASGFILQVHSLERPVSPEAPFTLCDPAKARRAVERAGETGVPFRIALPTYGYTTAFDRGGKFIGLSAEGPARNWPEGAQLREVRSDPNRLGELVAGWTAQPPAHCAGLIWYRLPVATDTLNWRWPTLAAVMAGRSPVRSVRSVVRQTEPGLVEVSLVNEGETDAPPPSVKLEWSSARLVAGDGLAGFELIEESAGRAELRKAALPSRILPPGARRVIGWLRFDVVPEVRHEMLPPKT